MNRKTKKAIITSIIMIIILTTLFGFENAWNIFNTTHLPVFILVGILCVALGISTRKWGRALYAFLALLITIVSLT